MTDKEFRQLKKSELIDIIYEYQKQEKMMQDELARLRKKVNSKTIKIEEAGSIAEAAVNLTGIFENAQKTADIYLANIAAAERNTKNQCERMIEAAEEEANGILAEARLEAARIISEAKRTGISDEAQGADCDDYDDDEDGGEDFEYIDC